MEKKEEIKLSQEEFKQLLVSEFSNEHKYVERYGQRAREALAKMADSTETVHSEKLSKDLTLSCSLSKERREEDGFVSFGTAFYKIRLLDGERELGKCQYQIEPKGVHLSFIGLNEDLDAEYQGKGLGSVMFDKLEEFCKHLGAEYIEGRYTPIGKFADASEAFYKRHGFKFEVDYEDHGRTYIRKQVQPEPEHTAVSESDKQKS